MCQELDGSAVAGGTPRNTDSLYTCSLALETLGGGTRRGRGVGGAKNAMKHRTHTQNTDGRR